VGDADRDGAGDLRNDAIAERLETLAALLDLAGSSFYSVRAYRRAAELVRSTPATVAELVRSGRVRELRGIGPSIETRLRELVETGRLAEIEELEGVIQPELVALGKLAGLGPQRMVELGRALGIRSADELRDAAAAGRLREVRGIGAAAEAKIREALERPQPVPRRALVLSEAWELCQRIADGVEGVVAGDPRRFCELSERLAIVASSQDPAVVIDRFTRLVEIVSVLDRAHDRVSGVTVEGVPVELVVAPPERFGTELLRATGSEAYVASLGTGPAIPSSADYDTSQLSDSQRAEAISSRRMPWYMPSTTAAPWRSWRPRAVFAKSRASSSSSALHTIAGFGGHRMALSGGFGCSTNPQ